MFTVTCNNVSRQCKISFLLKFELIEFKQLTIGKLCFREIVHDNKSLHWTFQSQNYSTFNTNITFRILLLSYACKFLKFLKLYQPNMEYNINKKSLIFLFVVFVCFSVCLRVFFFGVNRQTMLFKKYMFYLIVKSYLHINFLLNTDKIQNTTQCPPPRKPFDGNWHRKMIYDSLVVVTTSLLFSLLHILYCLVLKNIWWSCAVKKEFMLTKSTVFDLDVHLNETLTLFVIIKLMF